MNAVRYLFILNPKSFSSERDWEHILFEIHSFFDIAGHKNCALYVSRYPRDATGYIRSYARNLPKETTLRVYAVGGDGILFDCLNGIMGCEQAELAAIPYGCTNNFIQGFGKDAKTLFRDIERQLTAPVIHLDVMRYGNNYAMNYCTIGIQSEMIQKARRIREYMSTNRVLDRWLSRRLYNCSYFAGGIAACRNKKLLFQQYVVDIDGEIFSGAYQSLAVFNGPCYGGKMHPVNNAIPNDGMLDILFSRSRGILRTFGLYPFYLTGRSGRFPGEFTLKQGRKISVSSEDLLLICMDGEVCFDTQFTIELLPAAVRFVDAGRHGYKGMINR
jgi:diacylglycerol kinase family enzyme